MAAHPTDPNPMARYPIPHGAIMSVMGVAMRMFWAMPGRMRRLVVDVVLRRGVSLAWRVAGFCDVH